MQRYPPFNLDRITTALGRCYGLFELAMPPVVVARDLVAGFQLARGEADGVIRIACRSVFDDSLWGKDRLPADQAIVQTCFEMANKTKPLPSSRNGPVAVSIANPDPRFVRAYDRASFSASGRYSDIYTPARRAFSQTNAKIVQACFDEAFYAGLLFYFPMPTQLVLVPAPRITLSVANLHSDEKPAVAWRDGCKLHFLEGVYFSEPLWKIICAGSLTFSHLAALENIEQRRIAVKRCGIDDVLKGGGVILDTKDGYELFVLPSLLGQRAYFLKYRCPSTGREYISGINPDIGSRGSVRDAVAWKFHLNDGEVFTAES